MSESGKNILLSQRVFIDADTNEVRDCLDQSWAEFISAIGYLPVAIPNNLSNIDVFLRAMQPAGIVLTGGNDLVEYGGGAEKRDATEKRVVQYAKNNNIPLIGVCRGMQILQQLEGVRLIPLEGHVKKSMPIVINGKWCEKNSYHKWGTHAETPNYEVWAKAEDGTIKAIRSKAYNISAVMWHPERCTPFGQDDINYFKKIFDTADRPT